MRIVFLGDIVGNTGLKAVDAYFPEILKRFKPDLTIANAENAAASGRGLTPRIAEQLFDKGIEILTLGNHAWDSREIYSYLEREKRIVRPANFPGNPPGIGFTICKVNGFDVAIVNLLGRVFMSDYDSPFACIDGIVRELRESRGIRHIFVDFHAETSSEKMSFAWHVTGKVSAVVGTHTHVQTADERILGGGTAYLTDAGMTGAYDGIIGMKKEPVLHRFLTQMPVRFEVEQGRLQLHGACIDLDEKGHATHIERISCKPL
ncbi:TIGR00282 family metallophosphoesterase [Fodinisporobacter ferrooxydans]|uniref:TIGR00282 family metallophosphoesterase n=1 Tax=Fodinisporobacter ferrooxydans TaxID=2901836 RepID=A0ABY4CG86_9BACL|nr:TIGR00282 family metallophosphoesterase [Alicyclobacillaceae bacterium MYW30-H2]